MKRIQSKTICWHLVWLLISLFFPLLAFADGSDDFDDNKQDTTKWGADIMLALGVLTEQNGRLEFTSNNPLSNDDTLRPWTAERFPANADWTVQVDVFNNTVPDQGFEVNSAGMRLISPHSASTELDLELYASSLGLPNSVRKGFDADMETEDIKTGDTDTGGLAGAEAVNGAMRIQYTGATKVAEFFYDLDSSDGYQWTFIASYGIAGSGGTTANSDWGLSDTDQLTFYLWGYSDGMVISSGQIYLDDFVETGGVPSSGGPAPVPTGTFEFKFPTNHPLLTRILSLSGNYRGVTPSLVSRNYSFDVAQDESGKLAVMGTMDGLLNEDGNPEISGINAAVSTVNGEPEIRARGGFQGTQDGTDMTLKFSSAAPAEIIDIGEDSKGIAATVTYKNTIGGMPLSGKNMPLAIATPPESVDNLQQDWKLQLDITSNVVNGKQVPAASAQLTLPNGDVVSFPERRLKYSATKGYKLSFKKGRNTTADPARLDKYSSIQIQGLTFVEQGDSWQPTGGIIQYQFLGQKGSGDLLEFVSP